MDTDDGTVYHNFQRLLGIYGGYLENIQQEPDRFDTVSYTSYTQTYGGRGATTVSIKFVSMPMTIEFMQQIADASAAAHRRERLMDKYPAVREAWNHYKAIEALCNDDKK